MTTYEVAWEYLDPIFGDPRFVSDTMTQVWYYIASSASWQDWPNSALWLAIRAGKMERYCPFEKARFVPAITFRPSSSGCTTVFFCKSFPVTPALLLLLITGFLSELENKQVRRKFFQCSLWHIIHTLLTEPSWPSAWSMTYIHRKVRRTAKWRRRYTLRSSALS